MNIIGFFSLHSAVQLQLYVVIHTAIELSLLQLILDLFVCYCCELIQQTHVHHLLNWMRIWYLLSSIYQSSEKIRNCRTRVRERRGHIFIIDKALYGLMTSVKRWHERFSDVLRSKFFLFCAVLYWGTLFLT